MFSTQQLRHLFLQFFAKNDHKTQKSSSLLPIGDDSLLFVNAGMVQFKNIFLGLQKPPHLNLVSVQKCLRAGGKHNDLDNVGHTRRHHTFFEMLGNFSFGGLSKKIAIELAWQFLTQELKINPQKLYVTHFHLDLETSDIWQKILPSERIISINTEDNFWSMGSTGPQGPCTEIFYDYGANVEGGLPGSADQDGDRYVEIWNIVFMEEEKKADGSIIPLQTKCVDTGIGLERLLSVLNDQQDNYDCPDFQELITLSAQLLQNQDQKNNTHRVIADHIRSITFLISDGVLPGNEGRNYVLRRIIRRAMTYAYLLQKNLQPFLHKMVELLAQQMQATYPELSQNQNSIQKIILAEEESFLQTLAKGVTFLEKEIATLQNTHIFPGHKAFKLYDTYGFPLDLTEKILQMREIKLEKKSFEEEMNRQKQRSKNENFVFKKNQNTTALQSLPPTQFLGYEKFECQAKLLEILDKNLQKIEQIEENSEIILTFDQTVFYAESGGQVADKGCILNEKNEILVEIVDVQKTAQKIFLHFAKIKQKFSKNDILQLKIDQNRRKKIAANHTATHLLHKILRENLGNQVMQRGSLVEEGYFRFDFNHNQAIDPEILEKIELQVNQIIQANLPIKIAQKSYDQALQEGFTALFSEKYAEQVRTISIAEEKFSSKELCGGTHVQQTGQIGTFVITSEKSIATGIRRIEALTGQKALQSLQNERQILKNLSLELKQNKENLLDYFHQLQTHNKNLLQQIKKHNLEQLEGQISWERSEKFSIGALQTEGFEQKDLQELVKKIQNKSHKTILLFLNKSNNKNNFIISVNKDLMPEIDAKKISQFAKEILGFQGGGRENLSQGTINQLNKINDLIEKIQKI